jgi:hypothetical protein
LLDLSRGRSSNRGGRSSINDWLFVNVLLALGLGERIKNEDLGEEGRDKLTLARISSIPSDL